MKKIGILGSGIVAKTLGSGFLKHGYEVMLSSRDASKLDEWKNDNPNGQVGSFADAASFGSIVVLAVQGSVAKDAINLADPDHLSGKTVIDACNPIGANPPQNGVLHFFTDINKSLMEDLQDSFPAANFVKAFSCVGSHFMVNPNFEAKPSMFYCGNNEDAKDEVKEILNKFGHEPEDMGGAEGARAIEPLCMLWCIPGIREGQWSHAFRMMKA